MADETVSFKVFLIKADDPSTAGKPEVRRFGIDKDVVTNFDYLREKLQSVFPGLRGRRFTVTWKDEDEDDIAISSDEELQIALTETQDANIRKLYVVLHPEYAQEGRDSPLGKQDSGPGTVHVGVTCDGCQKDVQGFRYKCIQCPDFDLCMDCEAQGLHPQHCMIRISIPLQWRPHYGRRLAHHINKFAKKTEHCPVKEDGWNAYNRRHPRPARHPEGPSWLDTLATYLNDWAHLPGEAECPMKKSCGDEKTKENGPNEANKTGEAKNNPPNPHVEILKHIGDNIAQLLDPLGIDVNVQMKNDKATPEGSKVANNADIQETKFQTKFPGEGKKLVEDAQGSKGPAPTDLPSTSETASPTTGKQSLDTEGWTLLNEGSEAASTASPSSQQNGAIPKQVQPTAPTESSAAPKQIYPELPRAEKVKFNLPQESDEIVINHPNPKKIQRAVEAMKQMGFSNEGGWLTQLMISKDGDIGMALDVLQPVRQ